MQDADLRGANLRYTNLSHYKICPEIGGFYAWKKTTNGVAKIYIPADAKRCNNLIGRKCRASHIKVISGVGCGGKSPNKGNEVYEKGVIIHADKFDDDIRVECTNGIHFFMTEKEALEW